MHEDIKRLEVDTTIKAETRWRHVKTGHEYRVIEVGRIEADLEPVVIYKRAA